MTVLLIVFLSAMVLGMPISFAMLIGSLAYLWLNDISAIAAVQRIAAGPVSFPLLCVPFFILAGAIMNTGGITTRIFNWCNKLVGSFPGGLGYANILASVVFAGMSGTAVADAGGLGAIELKAMRDAGYDDDFTLAITASSSIVGPIIPPSLPAVLVGVIAGISIGRIFVGGILTGLLMAGILAVIVYIQAIRKNYPRQPRCSLREFLIATKEAFFSLMTVVIIIGGILTGVITPTEASVIAVVYSIVLGFAYKELNMAKLYVLTVESARITLSVLFIIACGTVFGWVMAVTQVPQTVSAAFVSYISNKYIALLVINIILLICGMFMETICAISLLTPVFMPIAIGYGIDPVHFSIIFILNLMIGLVTPPVGMVLYVLSSLSEVSFDRIVIASLPYVAALIVALQIVTYCPPIVTLLPNWVYN